MTPEDFEDLLTAGLPVHRMRDGTLRITETQLDRFLDQRTGLIPPPDEEYSGLAQGPAGACCKPGISEQARQVPTLRHQGPYRKREAAQLLGVSERTINRWAASGALKVFKKGRVFLVERSEIERLLKKHTR